MTKKEKKELLMGIESWFKDCIYTQQINAGKDHSSASGYADGSWLGARYRLGNYIEIFKKNGKGGD
jgi:hypothetical protein